MSYGFTVKGKTFTETNHKLRVAFARVLVDQPIHAADVPYQQAAVEATVNAHRAPGDDEHLVVEVAGSCTATNYPAAGYDRTAPGTPPSGDLSAANFRLSVVIVKDDVKP